MRHPLTIMYHTSLVSRVKMSRLKILQVAAKSLWTYVVLGLLVFYALLYLVLELPTNLEDFELGTSAEITVVTD